MSIDTQGWHCVNGFMQPRTWCVANVGDAAPVFTGPPLTARENEYKDVRLKANEESRARGYEPPPGSSTGANPWDSSFHPPEHRYTCAMVIDQIKCD